MFTCCYSQPPHLPGCPKREWYTFLNFYAVLHEEGSWFN